MVPKVLAVAGLLSSGLLSSCATTSPAPTPECEILDYGVMPGISEKRALEPLEDGSNTKLGAVGELIKIVETTDVIRPELGGSFGISHRFTGVPKDMQIKLVTSHPEISYEGKVSTGSTRYKRITDNGTSFAFDLPQEMAPGKWSFVFSFAGEELCHQDFTVLPPDT